MTKRFDTMHLFHRLAPMQVTTRDAYQVKAPQAIIHIKHTISLRQYKLWLVLLQHYKDGLLEGLEADEDGFYRMEKRALVELFGYEPTKDELRADLEKLRREPIIVNYMEKDGTPTQHGMGFVSEWKISTKAIRYKVPSLLMKVMQGLDQPKAIFQLINWQIFDHFTGKYEAIIYKLCRDYVGVRRTPYVSVDEFRDYMGLKPGEHEEFKALNRRVIDAPIKRINDSDLSDIVVSVKFNKSGRKVLGLYFQVDRKQQQAIPFVEFEDNPAFALAKVTIEPSTQAEYLAIRGPEDVALCIERGNEYGEGLNKQGKPVNYGAIYRKSISEGWHTQHLEKKTIAEEEEKKKRAKKDQEAREKGETEDQEKARKLLDSQVWESFLSLPEDDQDEQIKAVLEGKTIALAQYAKKGKTAPIVKSAVIAHLKATR